MNFDSSTGKKVSLSKLFNQPVINILFLENFIDLHLLNTKRHKSNEKKRNIPRKLIITIL